MWDGQRRADLVLDTARAPLYAGRMERPWETEPNELKWTDKATGLLCWIVRVRPDSMGHLCGYVAVPAGHPLHGQSCGGLSDVDFDVHGGVTWSGPHEGSTKWWFGFDCAHSGDLSPNSIHGCNEVYRDVYYVTEQCTKLARQIANWTPPQPASDR